MQQSDRLLLAGGMAAAIALLLLGMLLFELKRVDVLTQNTEAELQLGRLKRPRPVASPLDVESVESGQN